MAEKTKKAKTTTKKNLLYILWILALVAVMVTAVIVVSNLTASNNLAGNGGEIPDSSTVPDTSSPNPDSGDHSGDEPDVPGDAEPTTPTDGKIVFAMPCDALASKGYTADTIVYSSTLGLYTGHMGIDFAAPAGTEVYCVYDGVIESITTTYLTGTTVVVDHGNDLKTVYNSIEANEALYQGAKVSKGDLIGTVSDNNKQEYKDGAHLHFEVLKGGKYADPDEYLVGDEK